MTHEQLLAHWQGHRRGRAGGNWLDYMGVTGPEKRQFTQCILLANRYPEDFKRWFIKARLLGKLEI